MWQDGYEPDFECPRCGKIVGEEEYHWLVSMCKYCLEEEDINENV